MTDAELIIIARGYFSYSQMKHELPSETLLTYFMPMYLRNVQMRLIPSMAAVLRDSTWPKLYAL